MLVAQREETIFNYRLLWICICYVKALKPIQTQYFRQRDIRLGGVMFWNCSKKEEAEFFDCYFNAHHLVVERYKNGVRIIQEKGRRVIH